MAKDDFLKFKKLLRFVYENKYSDFYRIKFQKAGFDPFSDFNSFEDIKKIPFLVKKEFSDISPFKFLFINEKDVAHLALTSGTTGKPVIIFNSQLKDEDKTISEINLGRFFILVQPNVIETISQNIKINGNRIILGDIHNISASCEAALKFEVNTIRTTPNLAIILSNYLNNYPDLKKLIKFLILSGELVSPYKKKLLRKIYPDLKIFVKYSSAETRNIAFQCEHLAEEDDQIYFHPQVGLFHFEIIDPDTEEEVGPGEKGELVLTNFNNSASPMIRYKTGDLVTFENNSCSCGFPGPLLQIWGRINYDIVKAGGFELRTTMLEKPLFNLYEYLQGKFEAHVYENFIGAKPKIKLVLNLCLKDGVKESPELKTKIKNEILENWHLSPRFNLKKAIEAGFFETPQINFVEFSQSTKEKKALILHQP